MLLVKFTAVVVALLHTVWSEGLMAVGVGSTVMVKVSGEPVQPLAVGVTSMVPLMAALVELVAVKAAISPLPLTAKAIAVLSFIQS